MPFSARAVESALTGKLRMIEAPGRHRTYSLESPPGTIIAITHMSHATSGSDVSDSVLSKMSKQLYVSAPVLRGAVSCTVNRAAFVDEVLRGLQQHNQEF